MLDFIKGTLVEASSNYAVVEMGGLGFRLSIPANSFARLGKEGSSALFFLSLKIREEAMVLYGFLSKEERDLFDLLTSLSGIGPKTALALLGHMDFSKLCFALSSGDSRKLSEVPGIGKKTSERLIIDVKDKLKHWNLKEENLIPKSSKENTLSDALSALIRLGYPPIQAKRALQLALEECPEKEASSDVGKLISFALRKL